MDGTSRLSLPDGTPLQHALMTACFAERTVVAAAGAVPLPRELPLWQASLLGCGVVTAFGAVRNVARVRPGESAVVVGCGGVGLQVVAALRIAGADSDRRRRPRPGEARARASARSDARRGVRLGDDRSTRREADGARRRSRVRGRRTPGDDAPRLGLHPAGRQRRSSSGSPRAVSTSRSLRSSSSPTRGSAGRTTARATPARTSHGSRSSRARASSISAAS